MSVFAEETEELSSEAYTENVVESYVQEPVETEMIEPETIPEVEQETEDTFSPDMIRRIDDIHLSEEEPDIRISTDDSSYAIVQIDGTSETEIEYLDQQTNEVYDWYWADKKDKIHPITLEDIENQENGIDDTNINYKKEVQDGYYDIFAYPVKTDHICTVANLLHYDMPTALVGKTKDNQIILIDIPEWCIEEDYLDGLDLISSKIDVVHAKAILNDNICANPDPKIIVQLIREEIEEETN